MRVLEHPDIRTTEKLRHSQIREWFEALEKAPNRDADYMLDLYGGKSIICVAIRDHIDDGIVYAYASGFPHRQTKHNWTWSLVHSPTLTVVGAGQKYNEHQVIPMDHHDRTQVFNLEPHYLGANPLSLFDNDKRIIWPPEVLFLYPENFLVATQEREFIDKLVESEETRNVRRVLIITKSALLLTDMLQSNVVVLSSKVN